MSQNKDRGNKQRLSITRNSYWFNTFDVAGGIGRGVLVDGVARVVDVSRSCFGVFITLK